jgi:hypothetical protein
MAWRCIVSFYADISASDNTYGVDGLLYEILEKAHPQRTAAERERDSTRHQHQHHMVSFGVWCNNYMCGICSHGVEGLNV